MCGINGILSSNKIDGFQNYLSKMNHSLLHRGPDDSGFWVNEESNFGMGHTRLSIIDLSTLGHQPMVSSTGRYILSFNGEIYNFLELKKANNI